jgi:hypothetical protein
LSLPLKSSASEENRLHFISDQDQIFLRAVIPVILKDSGYSNNDYYQVIERIDETILHLGPDLKEDLSYLFSSMNSRFKRVVVTGIWASWDKVPEARIERFLNDWKSSDRGILFDGYNGIHDLIFGAWFSLPQSWSAIGYPGIPSLSEYS